MDRFCAADFLWWRGWLDRLGPRNALRRIRFDWLRLQDGLAWIKFDGRFCDWFIWVGFDGLRFWDWFVRVGFDGLRLEHRLCRIGRGFVRSGIERRASD